MNARRSDRDAVDRLLDTVPGPAADARRPAAELPGPIAELLAAATAPARPAELAGEDAATAAFRAARRAGVPPVPVRHPPTRRRLTASAGAWIAVVAATVTAGAALAADTRTPHRAPPPPPGPTAAPATPAGPPSPPATSPAPGPATTPPPAGSRPTATPGTGTGTGTGRGPGSAALHGQCRAYLATNGKANSPSNPAFAALVKAAGGLDRVDAYCRDLIAARSGGDPDAFSTGGGRTDTGGGRTDPPGKAPSKKPGGGPGR